MSKLLRILVLALLFVTGGVAADEYDQKLLATDMSDADSVYELATWCEKNDKVYLYRRYLQKVVELNPNHETARLALGYLFYNGKWTHKSRVPKAFLEGSGAPAAGGSSSGGAGEPPATGPAPDASAISWDLTVPTDPIPTEANWIKQQIDTMNRSSNFSNQMEGAYRTLLMDRYWPGTIPHLCAALLRNDFRDLYGASMIVGEVYRARDAVKMKEVRKLVPFMVKASERVTDGEDMWAFASVIAIVRERRAVPRLIEILDKMGGDAKDGARAALSEVTLIPEKDVDVATVRDWWSRYHASSDEVVFGAMLNSRDLDRVLKACERLVPHGWKSAIPALIRVIENGDIRQINTADAMLERLTAVSWLGRDPTDDIKAKKIEQLKKWWAENVNSFVPAEIMEQRNAEMASTQSAPQASPTQVVQQRIAKLDSLDKFEAANAQGFITKQGNDAVAALIRFGLAHNSGIIRERSCTILREITKQNFGFEGLKGSDADREAALAKWVEWASKEGLLNTAEEPEVEPGEVPAEEPAPPPEGGYQRPRGPLPF